MRSIAILGVLYIILASVICYKIYINPAYFLTPDSHYYIQAANNLLNGKGYTIWFENKETFCAIWPLGYAFCIALVSKLTFTSLTTASKIVNLLALAGCFMLLNKRFGKRSWLVAMTFGASSVVQLYANTWSEPLFVFFLLGFCGSLYKAKSTENQVNTDISLIAWATGAFLIRYIGGFLIIPLLIYKRWREAVVFLVVSGTYLLHNFYQTRTFTGGHGFTPTEPFATRLVRGGKGIVEEVLFWAIRDWDLKNPALSALQKQLIYGVAVVQIALLAYIAWQLWKHPSFKLSPTWIRTRSGILTVVGMSYLVAMVLIYLTDASIENLYFRRLTPATIFLIMSVLSQLITNDLLYQKLKIPTILFFLLSLFHALPKT